MVVFETPNPQAALVGAYTFWLDPSHLQPVPPPLLEFTLRYCGFRTEVLYLHPMRTDVRPRDPHVRQLYQAMFGFADYAVLGEKPL